MVAIDESASIRGISRSPAGLVAYGAENDSPAIWTSADGQSWDRYPVEIPDFGGWLAGAVSNGETIMTWGVIGAEPRDPNPVIRTALIDRYGPTVGSQVDYTYALSDNAPGRLIVYGPYGIPIEVLALDEMGVDSSLFQGSPTEPGPTLISQRGSDWQIQELPMSASVSSAFVGPDESLWALAQAPSGPMKAFNLSTDLVWTDRGFLPGTWRYTAAWLDTLLVVQNNPPDVQILSEGWEDRDISFDGWEGMGLVDLVLAPERTGIAFATTGDRSIVAIIREFSMGEPAQSSEPIEFEYSGNVVQVSRDMLTLLRDGALLIEVPLWQLRTGEGVVYDRALQKISLVNPFTGDTYVELDYAELQELETQHGRQPRFSEVANYLATTPDGCQWTTQVLADVGSLLSVHSVDQWVGLVSSGGDGFEVWVARHNPPVDCD